MNAQVEHVFPLNATAAFCKISAEQLVWVLNTFGYLAISDGQRQFVSCAVLNRIGELLVAAAENAESELANPYRSV